MTEEKPSWAEIGRLCELERACISLLAFIRFKYPEDFKEGGRGYICPHHKKIAELLLPTDQ